MKDNFNRYIFPMLLFVSIGFGISIAFSLYLERAGYQYGPGTYPGTGKLFSPQLTRAYFSEDDEGGFIITYNFAEYLIHIKYTKDKTPAALLKKNSAISVKDLKEIINQDKKFVISMNQIRKSASRSMSLFTISTGIITIFLLCFILSTFLNNVCEWANIKISSSQLNKEIEAKTKSARDKLIETEKDLRTEENKLKARNINISDLDAEIRTLITERDNLKATVITKKTELQKAKKNYEKLEEEIILKKIKLKKLPEASPKLKNSEPEISKKSIIELLNKGEK